MPRWKHAIATVACASLAECLAGLPSPNCAMGQAAPAPSATAAVDVPMAGDPKIEWPVVRVVSPQLRDLWLQALARPDAETQRQAVEAFGAAAAAGMPGVEDVGAKLAPLLDATPPLPVVRLAAARALGRLGAKESAQKLLEHNGDSQDMMLVTDAALAAWDFGPARAAWRSRLEDSNTPRAALNSAARALGAVHDADAAPALTRLATDRSRDPATRLCAARQLSLLAPPDLAPRAEKLLAEGAAVVERLIAATMLSGSKAPDEVRVLLRLADDAEPAVAAEAVRGLVHADPKLLAPLDEKLAASPDSTLRLETARALAGQASPAAVAILGRLLDDVSEPTRVYARDALLVLDRDASLRVAVRAAAVAAVNRRDGSRGPEQGLLLIGTLGERGADRRVVELLSAPTANVRVAAVVAARRLQLAEAPPVLRQRGPRLARQQDAAPAPEAPGSGPALPAVDADAELVQLVEALGALGDQQADPFLREFVPKFAPGGAAARAGAIWSLGKLHAGAADAALAKQLLARLTDTDSTTPEDDRVRLACAVTLGRMKAKGALETLRQTYQAAQPGDAVAAACRWAVGEVSGETLPPLSNATVAARGWFLEPAN